MSGPTQLELPSVAPAPVHHCHWPGCDMEVPPRLWGCRRHWFMLPEPLRRRVWAAYVPGQEITKTPSRAYLKVAREVQLWIAQHHAPPRAGMPR